MRFSRCKSNRKRRQIFLKYCWKYPLCNFTQESHILCSVCCGKNSCSSIFLTLSHLPLPFNLIFLIFLYFFLLFFFCSSNFPSSFFHFSHFSLNLNFLGFVISDKYNFFSKVGYIVNWKLKILWSTY